MNTRDLETALWSPLTGQERSRLLADLAHELVAQIDAQGRKTAFGAGRTRDRAGWVKFAEHHERLANGGW
jgi:hypothetical protein